MKKQSTFVQTGFTLVEVLIAVSILSLAILASFTAVSNNLKGTNFSQDEVEGYYLADESLEFIQNIRDENSINNTQSFQNTGTNVPWLTGIAQTPSDPCSAGKVCVVDSPLKTLTSCSGSAATCPVLRMDPTTGLFGYTASWTPTRFLRSLTVTVVSSTEAVVTATVTWSTNGITKNYVESETIRDWQ